MSVTIKSTTIGNYYIKIYLDKYSPMYHVALCRKESNWYCTTLDDRVYPTIEKAKRRYNLLVKRAKEEL